MSNYPERLIHFASQLPSPLYAVGGCVRDSLLGKQSHDIDLCSAITPETMQTLAKEHGSEPFFSVLTESNMNILHSAQNPIRPAEIIHLKRFLSQNLWNWMQDGVIFQSTQSIRMS